MERFENIQKEFRWYRKASILKNKLQRKNFKNTNLKLTHIVLKNLVFHIINEKLLKHKLETKYCINKPQILKTIYE